VNPHERKELVVDWNEDENGERHPADMEQTEATIEDLRRQLKAQEEKAQVYLSNWQRTQADLENMRKRVQQERHESMTLANSTLLRKILGAVDELDRAFSRPATEMCEPAWAEGARMSFQALETALESEGLKQIDAVGEEFDPRYHEAMLRRPGNDGIVLEVLQKGYTLNGRVLRPSKVVVGSSEHTESEDEE
jgi:molecular chaperone GrpE